MAVLYPASAVGAETVAAMRPGLTKQEPTLKDAPPDLHDLNETADEVRTLSKAHDAGGTACGVQNLGARWQSHVAQQKGITAELAMRNPDTFRFSILEQTSPNMVANAVIALEQTWKRRLDTLHPHGLNRN